MDDIEIILYIAFVLFAIISRALKKKKATPKKSTSSSPENSPSQKDRPLTFEELLKEFTEGREEEEVYEEPEPVRRSRPSYERYDDDEAKRVYEESIRASQSYERQTSSGDDRHMGNFIHFRGYSEEDTEEGENQYSRLFRDPKSARDAIIASEILKRRY